MHPPLTLTPLHPPPLQRRVPAAAARAQVAYYYDSEVGTCYYGACKRAPPSSSHHLPCESSALRRARAGANHPMKPHRLCMTHHMVMAYDLHKRMSIYVRLAAATARAHPASPHGDPRAAPRAAAAA